MITGVVPALVTPFKEDGSVNTDIVPELIEFHISAGVGGFYLCGNTGEGKAQTPEERKVGRLWAHNSMEM